MRLSKLGIRHRVLAACFVISLGAVAALSGGGLAFRQVLRTRARESCVRTAAVFEGLARSRLIDLVAETAALADTLDAAQSTPGGLPDSVPAGAGVRSLLSSWAVYDRHGCRTASQRSRAAEPALEAIGIAAPAIAPRERARFAEALGGSRCTLLVPGGHHLYALHYVPIPRNGPPRAVLQTATEMADSLFPAPEEVGGARAVLRPFVATVDTPCLVSVDGEPRLLVHRPVLCGGRQLGSIAAAVPYGTEARYEQAAILAIFVLAIGVLLVLAIVSYHLTNVAMVPLERVRHFVRRIQSGGAVEQLDDIPNDEAGALLEAYQQALAQSQGWADRIVEFSRAHHELLCGAVEALVSAIEAKDDYTAGHSQRVADAACSVARELGWDNAAVEQLRLGAILHDIGKIGINLGILNKPASLDPEETEAVHQHPVIGARILSSIPGCEDVVRMVLYHHERYDGNGYPTGAAGDAIPAAAAIVAIADVYDALTSRRSYRPAHPAEEAAQILLANRGTMFHPELLDVFIRVIRRSLPMPHSADAPRADEGHDGSPDQQSPTNTEVVS